MLHVALVFCINGNNLFWEAIGSQNVPHGRVMVAVKCILKVNEVDVEREVSFLRLNNYCV